ncbi:MAG: RNA polymerase sigma-70 factor (ECF subfamily) [Verrucomicrobiales bacterium]|jgi:RNA polymerase sigma-70 factor (ECF subfamily)
MNSLALTMPGSTTPSRTQEEAAAADDSEAEAQPLSDRARFSALMRANHRELLVYARALTGDHHGAQDVVQDSLVAAFAKFATFDEAKDFGAWVRGFIRFKTKDWFRRKAKTPPPTGDDEQIGSTLEKWQTAKIAGTGSVFEALESCLKLLPDRLGQSVKSVYFNDEPGPAAAESLGISAASLRKRLERARGQLHACITRKLQS